MVMSYNGMRCCGAMILSLSLAGLLPGQLSRASAAATAAVGGGAKRPVTQLLHGTIKSIDDARSLTVTDTALGSLKVTLTARGKALVAGKTAALTDFHAGEMVGVRGHLLQAGQFSATLIMDSSSETLAAQTRRSPEMKVSAIDAASGQVTLESTAGNIRIQAPQARIRMGRKEMGATTGLSVGQTYGVRLGTGPDGEPDISLTNSSGAAGGTRKRRTTPGAAGAATPAPTSAAGTH